MLYAVSLGGALAQASEPSTQFSPAPLPLQGDCDAAEQSDTRGPGMAVSTIACPGESAVALSFAYRNGANESCLYIDNGSAGFGHRPVSYFVPLNTAEEWQGFKASTQSGTLSSSVRLVYGCNADRVPSPCGGTVSVPVKRNGQTATVTVTPHMTATYTCTALTGCGSWNLTKTTGSCPINGACGSSDGTSLTQAPSTGLCTSGTASAVTGSGPWSWSCQGQYGGITTQCTASQTPQSCEPNIQITGYGPCSAACGGGTRDVYRDDGCGNSSTSSAACNTQACTCTSTSWIYDGAGPCSAPCGGGLQAHSWHDNCGASTSETRPCNTQACTCTSTGWVYDGASACSAPCGGGTQTHSWHDNCGASTSASEACNTQACRCEDMSFGCGVDVP